MRGLACLALSLLVSTAPAVAAGEVSFWVSVGSFKSLEVAEGVRDRAIDALAQGFQITPTETERGSYYRVLGGPFYDVEGANDCLRDAIAGGYADAWLLRLPIGGGASSLSPRSGTYPDSGYALPDFSTGDLPDYTSNFEASDFELPDYDADLPDYDADLPDYDADLPDYDADLPALAPTSRDPAIKPTDEPALEAPADYKLHKLRRKNSRIEPIERGPETGPVLLDVRDAQAIALTRVADEADIEIDGRLDEAAWRNLPTYGDFYMVQPDTLETAKLETEVRIFYTSKGFYLSANMQQDPQTLVERLSSRDQGHLNRDYFSFTLDTSGEGRYGFWFQLNLGDSVSDGTILPERQYSRSWDGAWYGATARTETGWIAEFFIPWSLVSMPQADGERSIGFYGSRQVAYLNERWGWPALPFTKPKFMSSFQQLALSGVDPRQQYSVYPYVSTTLDSIDDEVVGRAGVDLFWRPSTNFQLTATLNPDFGNVEADDVIVNLSAFETFFPEKRLFFQEGQEIFTTSPRAGGRGGRNGVTTLLHTRRIGGLPRTPDIPPDVDVPSQELARPTELLGAIKTTGQTGRLRYGLLAAAEDETQFRGTLSDGTPVNLYQTGRNFGAVRLLYEKSNGSYEALGWMSTGTYHRQGDAEVHAVDGHILTSTGKWKADGQVMTSRLSGANESDNGYGGFLDVTYAPTQGLTHSLSFEHFDENLDINDLGFLRRNNLTAYRYQLRLQRSNLGWVRNSQSRLFWGQGWNDDGELIMGGMNVGQDFLLNNQARVRVGGGLSPGRFEDRNSFGNGSYRIEDRWEANARYESDSSRRFGYRINVRWNEEDLGGERVTYGGDLTWRPTDRLTMEIGLDYATRDGWLLHQEGRDFTTFDAREWLPKFNLDYFISAKQQFRVALQWVGIDASESEFYQVPLQPGDLVPVAKAPGEPRDDFTISQLNFQVRYRWELAPMSDLFVVYTKNAQLPSAVGQSFGTLFEEAFDNPLSEQFAVKLRYRLGS